MKYLILSDTHGSEDRIIKAVRQNPDAQAVFFLGDGLSDLEAAARTVGTSVAWLPVRGNCDFQNHFLSQSPVAKIESITLEGKRIVYTHGDMYSVKSSMYALMELAQQKEADAVLFGHTHQPYSEYHGVDSRGVFFFNPGSASANSYPSCYGIMEINEKGIFFSHKKL